jgi:hypothetical protein
MPALDELEHGMLAALLLRSVGIAVLSAAGAVAAMAWVGSWDGAPHFGVAAYLFASLVVGAGMLLVLAKRVAPVRGEQTQPVEEPPLQ